MSTEQSRITISNMKSTWDEAINRYREAIIFGNKMALQNMLSWEAFKRENVINRARSRGASDDQINFYLARHDVAFKKKFARIEHNMAISVESRVHLYDENLKKAFII